MRTLSIDIETFSKASLPSVGVYRYAADESFEILLFAYAVDGGEVQIVDLARGEQIPGDALDALEDPGVVKSAFNAAFERVCLSAHLGHRLDPEGWRCSMVWASFAGVPLDLAGVAKALHLDTEKMGEGKNLIRYFSLPAKPTKANGGRERNLPEHAPDDWETFKAYCKRDVEVELAITKRLHAMPMPAREWDNYWDDQRINDRGVRIDADLATAAVDADNAGRASALEWMRELTRVDNPASVTQLLAWLRSQGLQIDSLAKADVAAALEGARGDVAEVLALRQEMAKSSVKKYERMLACRCPDGRAHGLLQFMGAGRTGRWAGRLVQVQNLPRQSISDLEAAADLVRTGHADMLETLWGSAPQVLSELIRAAFVAEPGSRFLVADYSAIEARTIAWLAGEQWVLDLFEAGGDIYCETGTRMFRQVVEKHSPLRQRAKVAVLACIAEGQPVLTRRGLVPIEDVTPGEHVWDGVEWVTQEGPIFKGVRDVITHDGLTATPDHLVWVEGEQNPIPLGEAASCGARLLRAGHRGKALRVGGDHQPAKEVEQLVGELLRGDSLHGMRKHSVDEPERIDAREDQRVPSVLNGGQAFNPPLAGPKVDGSETALREPEQQALGRLRRTGDPIQVPVHIGSRSVDSGEHTGGGPGLGAGQDRHERPLRAGEHPLRHPRGERREPKKHGAQSLGAEVLAVRAVDSVQEARRGEEQRANHRGCAQGSAREAQGLAHHRRKARVYDLLNAGPRRRFTVSDALVHNCGYQGGVGALKTMGGEKLGLSEEEMADIVAAWRAANPAIARLWWDINAAAIAVIKDGGTRAVGRIRLAHDKGALIITLPSGRPLVYPSPRIGENRFGGESITHMGVGVNRKWGRIETYGGKLTENIVQATARDILAHAIARLERSGYPVVMHIHDEVVTEVPEGRGSVEELCALMSQAPPWADGLPLAAEGFESTYYRKG